MHVCCLSPTACKGSGLKHLHLLTCHTFIIFAFGSQNVAQSLHSKAGGNITQFTSCNGVFMLLSLLLANFSIKLETK